MNAGPERPTLAVLAEGAALCLLWLVAAGAAFGTTTRNAWLGLCVLPAIFVALHVATPAKEHLKHGRVGRFPCGPFLAWGLPITLLLALGDLLWLVGGGVLDPSAEGLELPMLLGFVLVFPMIEEFGFRLWLQTPLERVLGTVRAIAAVAVLFGLLHSVGSPWPQTISGFVHGVAIVATGSVWVPTAMHTLGNGALLGLEVVPGVRELALELSADPPAWMRPVGIAAWGVALALAAWWLRGSTRD